MKALGPIIGLALIVFLAVVAVAGTLTNPSGAVAFVICMFALLGVSWLIRSSKAGASRQNVRIGSDAQGRSADMDVVNTVESHMQRLNPAAPNDADKERTYFRQELASSVKSQDSLMMTDIAKVLHKVPDGSSVIAFRQYHGTVLAGPVVLDGNTSLMFEMFHNGVLNPDGSPGLWRLIPKNKLDLLKEFVNPPEAALAYFVLTPAGHYALAFSHIVRSDNDVHWVSDTDFVRRIADVLVEAGLFQGKA
jgi:hypothetical protein